MRRALVALVAVLIGVTAAARGQEWSGSEGLGVQVTDEAGQAIEGAAVLLGLETSVGLSGPRATFTDAEGRVEYEGLAAGEWQVEVRAEGYMIFTGYLKLGGGRDPALGFTSRQRTGSFWAPLEVQFYERGREPLPVVRPRRERETTRVATNKDRRKLEKQAEKRRQEEEKAAQRREKDEARLAERQARRQAAGEVAVLRPPPTPEPTPRPTAVPTPEPPVVAARAADEPSTDSAAEPREARAVRPPAEPEPQPEPQQARARVAEGETEPDVPRRIPDPLRPAPPAPKPPAAEASADARQVPDIQSTPFLFRGGACPECKPGELALVVERQAATAGEGNPIDGCAEARSAVVPDLVSWIAGQPDSFASRAAPLLDMHGNHAWRQGAPPADAVLTVMDASGPCQHLAAVLPAGARFIGFRYEIEDDTGSGECMGVRDCSTGQARWLENPRIERTPTVTLIHSSFVNQSRSRQRRARMTLYFVPPSGFTP